MEACRQHGIGQLTCGPGRANHGELACSLNAPTLRHLDSKQHHQPAAGSPGHHAQVLVLGTGQAGTCKRSKADACGKRGRVDFPWLHAQPTAPSALQIQHVQRRRPRRALRWPAGPRGSSIEPPRAHSSDTSDPSLRCLCPAWACAWGSPLHALPCLAGELAQVGLARVFATWAAWVFFPSWPVHTPYRASAMPATSRSRAKQHRELQRAGQMVNEFERGEQWACSPRGHCSGTHRP